MSNRTHERLVESLVELIAEESPNREVSTDDIDDFESAVESIVEKSLNDFQVEAGDVSGLDDAIDNKLSDHEVEAKNVDGIEDLIDERIDNWTERNLAKEIDKELLKKYPGWDAEQKAMEDRTKDIVEKKLAGMWGVAIYGIIESRVAEKIASIEWNDMVGRLIDDKMKVQVINPPTLLEILASPVAQTMIQQEVRKALAQVVQSLIAPPVAPPVQEKEFDAINQPGHPRPPLDPNTVIGPGLIQRPPYGINFRTDK